jgi:arginase
MHSRNHAPGQWDVLVSPWHLNEKIVSFPSPGGAAPLTRSSYPGSSETGALIDRYRDIADAVAKCDRPMLLSGDCLAAVGMVAGLQRTYSDLNVVWLDAHGDFNTPSISKSGYLAGMSLAMATGRAPEVISASVGLRPVADDRALLIDARDLDDQERDALRASAVRRTIADPVAMRAELEDMSPGSLYIHLDIDILDGSDLPAAMRWETSPGPSLATVEECLTQIVDHSPPVGVCIACPWPAERIGEPGVAQTISRLAKAPAADL